MEVGNIASVYSVFPEAEADNSLINIYSNEKERRAQYAHRNVDYNGSLSVFVYAYAR